MGKTVVGDGRPLRAKGSARAADAVWLIHTAILIFFTVAWALPFRWALWTAVVGAFVMQIQWWLNDGICVLTKLERTLRGLPAVPASDEGAFIAELAARVVGRPVPRRYTNGLTYLVLWGGAAIAAIRLARG